MAIAPYFLTHLLVIPDYCTNGWIITTIIGAEHYRLGSSRIVSCAESLTIISVQKRRRGLEAQARIEGVGEGQIEFMKRLHPKTAKAELDIPAIGKQRSGLLDRLGFRSGLVGKWRAAVDANGERLKAALKADDGCQRLDLHHRRAGLRHIDERSGHRQYHTLCVVAPSMVTSI